MVSDTYRSRDVRIGWAMEPHHNRIQGAHPDYVAVDDEIPTIIHPDQHYIRVTFPTPEIKRTETFHYEENAHECRYCQYYRELNHRSFICTRDQERHKKSATRNCNEFQWRPDAIKYVKRIDSVTDEPSHPDHPFHYEMPNTTQEALDQMANRIQYYAHTSSPTYVGMPLMLGSSWWNGNLASLPPSFKISFNFFHSRFHSDELIQEVELWRFHWAAHKQCCKCMIFYRAFMKLGHLPFQDEIICKYDLAFNHTGCKYYEPIPPDLLEEEYEYPLKNELKLVL